MGDDSPVQTELVSTGSQFSHFWEINTGDNLEFFCWVCFCVLCLALCVKLLVHMLCAV